MGIGIDIRVNRQQVTDAKREVELLADKASKLNDKEFTIVGGVNSGGPSGTDATVNAGAMDRTAKSAIAYRKEMEGTRRVVSDIAKDYDKLIKTMTSFRGAAATAAPGVGTVSSAESARMHKESQRAADAFWKEASEPRKRETAADRYFKQHGNYGRTVISRPDSDGPDGGSSASTMGNTIKKAVGWGLAAAGGFSLLGFLGSSRAQYQQAVGHEGRLNARGIKGGYNDGVGIGIGPLEQMQMLENISQSTGMSGKKATSAANLAGTFGKFTGTDPSQVSALYGTMYQATGNQQAGTGALTMMGEAIKKGMEKARVPELLQLVSRNTQATAQAMGGAGGSKQAGAATILAIEAMKAHQAGAGYSNYAKSGEFQHVMQNGLQGAGTGAGDIRLFKAMGGFDGPMSYEKIHEMNIMKQGGFLQNPALMSKILGSLSSTTDKGKAGELETMMDSWGIKGLASEKIIGMSKKDDKTGMSFFDQLEKAIKKSGSFEKLSKGSAEDKKMYSEMQKAIGENPAVKKEALEATRQMVKVEAGEQLNEIFGSFEDGALKFSKALMDGNWKEAFHSFENAAKALGPIGTSFGFLAAAITAAPFIAGLKTIAGIGAAAPVAGGVATAAGLGVMGKTGLVGGTLAASYLGTTALLNTDEGRTAQAEHFAAVDRDTNPTDKAKIRAEIRRAARARGLDKEDESILLAMVETESDFNPKALGKEVMGRNGRSRGKARGLWQIMPENAPDAVAYDVGKSTAYSVGEYAKRLKTFKGDKIKAAAGHNAGTAGVQNSEKTGKLPTETEEYVKKIKSRKEKYNTREGVSGWLFGSNDEVSMERSPYSTFMTGGYDRQQQNLDHQAKKDQKGIDFDNSPRGQQIQNAGEIGDAMAAGLSRKLDELISALRQSVPQAQATTVGH